MAVFTLFLKKSSPYEAQKYFFSKNHGVISKIGLLEAFTICFGITHLKGEVLSPRFEKQVHFWNWGSFHHFSRTLQLKIVKISFSSQNFDFYKNSQKCPIMSTVVPKHVLDVPKQFSNLLRSYNWLWSILSQNQFLRFFEVFLAWKWPFLHYFWRKAHHMRPKNIFFEKSRRHIKNRASRGFYNMLWHYAPQRRDPN